MSRPLNQSLWKLVEYILRDFVEYWFLPNVSKNKEFINELKFVFQHLLKNIIDHSKNISYTNFLKDITTELTILLRLYRITYENVLKKKKLKKDQDQSNININEIENELKKNFKFHIAVLLDKDNKNPSLYEQFEKQALPYLRNLSDAFLKMNLLTNDYSCTSIRYLLRECLAKFVFLPIMGFCSPYWINIGLHYMISSTLTTNNDDDNQDQEDQEEEEDDDDLNDLNETNHHHIKTKRHSSISLRVKEFLTQQQLNHKNKVHNMVKKDSIISNIDHIHLGTEWDLCITSSMTKFDPKPYISYVIMINTNQYHWIIHKRYSQFIQLDTLLKKEYKNFIKTKLPPKQWFANNFHQDFIKKRINQLQKYLDIIIRNNEVIQNSQIFKQWIIPNDLSSIKRIKKKKKNSEVSLQQQILPQQQFLEEAQEEEEEEEEENVLVPNISPPSIITISKEEQDKAMKYLTQNNQEIIDPIISLFNEIIKLKYNPNNTLIPFMKQNTFKLITIIIKLFFDKTLEQNLYLQMKEYVNEQSITKCINWLVSILWPNGELFESKDGEETDLERQQIYQQVYQLLHQIIIPDLNLITRQIDIQTLFLFLQSRILISHLGFTILDTLIIQLYPSLSSLLRTANQRNKDYQ